MIVHTFAHSKLPQQTMVNIVRLFSHIIGFGQQYMKQLTLKNKDD